MKPAMGVNIVWHPNPLRSRVEVNEFGQEILWHRLKLQELEECIISAECALDPKFVRPGSPERTPAEVMAKVKEELRSDYILGDVELGGKKIDDHVTDRLTSYLEHLTEAHDGDCTCVACSCMKCHAEQLLGTDSTVGLDKHAGCYIKSAFRGENGKERSLEEAIEILASYVPVFVPGQRYWTRELWEQHAPRWAEDHKRAAAWLEAYRSAHF